MSSPTDKRKEDVMALTISPELQSLIPPLSPEELDQLTTNLLKDGCLNPLVVWQQEQILLDGHHRLKICEQHGLAYQTHELSLPDMDAAQLWILRHQRGRRNLTPNQLSYARGKEYEIQKRQGQRTDLTSGKSYQKLPHTATALAQEHQVSEKTIRNDFAYSTALDTLADTVGKEVLPQMRDRDRKLTQQDVKALAKMATKWPSKAREALDAVGEAQTPRQARQRVREKAREVREYDERIERMLREHEGELGLLVLEPEAPDAEAGRLPPAPTPTMQQQAWDLGYLHELERRLTQALESLDHLHTYLSMRAEQELAAGGDWLGVPLSALLEHEAALCLRVSQGWGRVEMFLRRSETVCQGICGLPPVPALEEAVPSAEAPPRLRDQVSGLQQAVLQTVAQLEPCTNSQVRQALGKKRSIVHAALQALVKQGKVTKEGQTYRVVDAPA
jgi:ParB-like chromosome segregation protein Spo0J